VKRTSKGKKKNKDVCGREPTIELLGGKSAPAGADWKKKKGEG